VFRFLGRLCRDQAQAEDLTQETFLRIHRARGLYRPGAAVLPWAYTIARRLFLDAVRARKAEPLRTAGSAGASVHETEADVVANLPAEAPTAEQLLADRQLAVAIDEALARLPERQAVAFRLLKSEGLSVAETAAVMGTTQGAVKLRAHRAYEALRALLAGRFAPPAAKATVKQKADGGTR
jgi:RNA polymerase sigma-70 factor (ECF subfamily)